MKFFELITFYINIKIGILFYANKAKRMKIKPNERVLSV